jgi:excisionase family DNA binding protein
MRYTYEAVFEKGQNKGWYVVTFPDLPFIFTQGIDRNDAINQAAEALELGLVSNEMDGNPAPKATFGHCADNGFVVALSVVLRPRSEVIDTITTTEAAEILGLSQSRVRQLILSGHLKAKRKGRDHLVNLDSVDALLKNPLPVGRPRKTEQTPVRDVVVI